MNVPIIQDWARRSLEILSKSKDADNVKVALREFRQELGVDQKQMASFLRIGARTYQRWEQEGITFHTPRRKSISRSLESLTYGTAQDAAEQVRTSHAEEMRFVSVSAFEIASNPLYEGLRQLMAKHQLNEKQFQAVVSCINACQLPLTRSACQEIASSAEIIEQ